MSTRAATMHADGRDMTDGLFGYTIKPAEMPVQPDKDRAYPGDITTLCDALRGHGGITREELAANLGWSERKVRDVAECSGRVVSAPGVKGFFLASEVTVNQWESLFQPAWLKYMASIQERYSRQCSAVHGNGKGE